MRLVVDLNDELYNNMVVKNEYTDRDVIAVHNALMGAIFIPKGHGRLIDAKQAEERLRQAFDEHEGYNSLARYIVRNSSETPTIIEADKEGEQE